MRWLLIKDLQILRRSPLLVAMLVLLWYGPGAHSLSSELNRRRLRT